VSDKKPYKVIIAGGGTGGHVFPAIAIANRLKADAADTDILFVGAKGKLEMTKVPEAGYNIIGLPISGFQRSMSLIKIEFTTLPHQLVFMVVDRIQSTE